MTVHPLAQHSWEDHEVITVVSKSDQLLGTFPMSFLRQAGVNPRKYFHDVIGHYIENIQDGTLYTQDGVEVHSTQILQAGDYRFMSQGEFYDPFYFKSVAVAEFPGDRSTVGWTISWTNGPECFRRDVPPNPSGSQSTRSNSKRSTAQQVCLHFCTLDPRLSELTQQSAFRVALIARDFACLVTDAAYEECTACHIVPQSRPDVNLSSVSCLHRRSLMPTDIPNPTFH